MKKIAVLVISIVAMLVFLTTQAYADESHSTLSAAHPKVTDPQNVGTTANNPAESAVVEGLEQWRRTMKQLSTPGAGCFKATYPKIEWKQMQETKAPAPPLSPSHRINSDNIGFRDDWSVKVKGLLSSVTGSFDSVSGVTSVTDYHRQNDFELQLNSQSFDSPPICHGSDCQGWQQFLYSSNYPCRFYKGGNGCLYIQYSLSGYSEPCPKEWAAVSENQCIKNSKTCLIPPQTIARLADMSLTGVANADGDEAILSIGKTLYTMKASDNSLDLDNYWKAAQFNIFGNGGGSLATFNPGSTITVRVTVDSGTMTDTLTYEKNGYTAEANNLNLIGQPTILKQPYPAIVFKESNVKAQE